MRRRTLAFGLGAVLLLVSGVAAYRFSGSDMLQDNGDKTRKAVLERIPLGTETSRGATIMAAEGFKCRRMYSGFSDDRPGSRGQVSYPPANILWCDRERMVAPLISRRWQVTFVDSGGIITQVAVGVSLTGL